MKITIEHNISNAEDEIIIRCKVLDDEILKMVQAVQAKHSKLAAYNGNEIVFLLPENIFYFEAVDNKVFACYDKQVYEIRQKLYEIEERYENTDFLRISKSVILNLSKISHLSPSFNGRFDAKLKNNEIVVISRQYVPLLKKKLGL